MSPPFGVYKEWSSGFNRVTFEGQAVGVGDASSGIHVRYTKSRRDVTLGEVLE